MASCHDRKHKAKAARGCRKRRSDTNSIGDEGLRKGLVLFICVWISITTTAALLLFFLEGFRMNGFHLEPELMYWIGTVTLGCVCTLATMVYRCLFH